MKSCNFALDSVFFLIYFLFSGALSSDIEFDKAASEGLTLIKNEVDSFGLENRNFSNSTPCNDQNRCSNRGLCYNNVCICQPGTSGPFCRTIDGCSGLECGDEKTAECAYDERNFLAYCKCKSYDHVYDSDAKQCRECKCDNCTSEMCLSKALKCEFVRGDKVCSCRKNDAFNPKTQICEFCYCGDEYVAKACKFDDNGDKKCVCHYGNAMSRYSCERCDCGMGNCEFQGSSKVCKCFSGYSENKGYCSKCDCGENGKCKFGRWNKKEGCECNHGYVEVGGSCVKECYCGNNGNCTVESEKKICKCPEGFTNINGLCTDINECDDPDACASNMECINTAGSYYCVCRKGFNSSTEEPENCKDINECLLSNPCADSETECLNTIGSFKCVCKSGYVTRMDAEVSISCESKSSWKLGFGLLIGIFVAVIIGLMIFIYRRY